MQLFVLLKWRDGLHANKYEPVGVYDSREAIAENIGEEQPTAAFDQEHSTDFAVEPFILNAAPEQDDD